MMKSERINETSILPRWRRSQRNCVRYCPRFDRVLHYAQHGFEESGKRQAGFSGMGNRVMPVQENGLREGNRQTSRTVPTPFSETSGTPFSS
ncbi:hypothetical protein [Oxalobacter paraformigenes]|uniref:hypothetical protein n=1 Tax=Oxalobacter paraformigenes TaxID=556268 RepID=UPI0011CA2C6E|nr:hypothetical protein [Oxalobacter paraformigenes]